MPSSYISVSQASKNWGISERRIQTLCREGRIDSSIRIGKMWMIPEDAKKPNDARLGCEKNQNNTTYHKMRLLLKRTITQLFEDNKSNDCFLTMQQTLSYYASFLLRIYNEKDSSVLGSQELAFIENTMKNIYSDYESLSNNYNAQAIQEQLDVFEKSKAYLIDSLSWAFQYLKKYCPTDLSSTQFFTERYMISTLVDYESIKLDDKILDPSCGGGNFLIHIYEKKLSDYYEKNDYCSLDTINSILATLRGYDLDKFLSLICYFNLVIVTIIISKNNGHILDISDLLNINVNIFANVDDNLEGFLNDGDSIIFNVSTREKIPLSKLVDGIDYIFTNPPFETVKGMKKELKEYLKKNHPLCKCDLCVAFLLKIVECMPSNTKCGLVLQNSWMFLKSFNIVRKIICDNVALNRIIILGSGAFSDISGEKASVSLVNISKTCCNTNITSYVDLTPYKRLQKESLLASNSCNYKTLPQSSLFETAGSIRNDIIDKLTKCNDAYSVFATPMQGTSTGDSKKHIDYYWMHLGDFDWKLVSKGGGYSRWYGLNQYVIHWGSNGEFIKGTPGSALRNIKFFKETSMVFSDTGTSGLNVRSLCDGQIFVASGPGIRIHSGNVFNHLAFLNSKYASYCIRHFTPKLTIAAGYIAKIPANEEIFKSNILSSMGQRCHHIKKIIYARRPIDVNFSPDFSKYNLDECVEELIIREMTEELEKINLERAIDDEIFRIMNINMLEENIILKELDSEIEKSPCTTSIEEIDKCISSILDYNCTITRTRTSKNSLGCDGPLEYASHILHCSPESIAKKIIDNVTLMANTKSAYLNFVIHSKILIELDFNRDYCTSKDVIELSNLFEKDSQIVAEWIRKKFNTIHPNAFYKKPIYRYDEHTDFIRLCTPNVN